MGILWNCGADVASEGGPRRFLEERHQKGLYQALTSLEVLSRKNSNEERLEDVIVHRWLMTGDDNQ